MVGNILGNRYEVLERIGTGGMSLVYRARDITLNRLVAVKILKHQWAEDDEVVRRFEQEARAAASLVDRHIVQVYDVGRDEPDVHYMVMELVAGETLRQKIDREAPLAPDVALGIADQVARGLEVAHARRLVHRDIKPQNILLTPEGEVKVTDFGIAYAATTGTLVNTGSLLGTVQYLSPEQARGKLIGPQSDLYSLGIVMFEMLTGRLPFEGDSAIGVAIKHLQDEPPRVDALRPEIPAPMADVVERALSKDPAERYQSAHALRLDIGRLLHPENPPIEVAPAVPKPEDSGRGRAAERALTRRRRRWLPYVIVAVVLLLVLGGGAYAFHRWLNPPVETVPNLTGKSLAEARRVLAQHHLTPSVGGHASSPSIAKDHVVKEDPSPGSSLKSGERVILILSSGPTSKVVPDVRQKDIYIARTALKKLGFKVRMRTRVSSLPKGEVFRQSPGGGTTAPVGSTVTLWVSSGSSQSQAVMPNLTGLTPSQAASVLAQSNVTIGTPSLQWSTEPMNTIMDQNPAPYSSLNGVTSVSVTESRGPTAISASQAKNISHVRLSISTSASPKSLLKVVVTDQAGNEEVFYRQVNPGETVPLTVTWYGSYGQLVDFLNGKVQPGRRLTPQTASSSSPSPSPPSSSPSSPSSPPSSGGGG